MHMRVVAMVVMLMVVNQLTMRVHMRVRVISPCLAEPPAEIHETECEQRQAARLPRMPSISTNEASWAPNKRPMAPIMTEMST